MPDRIRCSARVRVALPAARAIELFTPEGERGWTEGWQPRYPAGDATPEEGMVFLTHGHGETIWIVLESGRERVRYARVSPGDAAGTVTVACVREEARASVFEVAYDLTALSEQGSAHLEAFERGYAAEMAGWERAIAATVEG